MRKIRNPKSEIRNKFEMSEWSETSRGCDPRAERALPMRVILSEAKALRSAVEGPLTIGGRRRRLSTFHIRHPSFVISPPPASAREKLEVLRLRSVPPSPARNSAQDDGDWRRALFLFSVSKTSDLFRISDFGFRIFPNP